jgi:serine/threonine protein kinase
MPDEFKQGTYIERYRVERLLGAGGSSKVYQVFEEELQRKLSVKVLHLWSVDSHDSVLRFEREARVLSQLAHPNIVRVYRFGFLEDNVPFLVMELLEGDSLRSILEKRKQLPCNEAVRIAEQVSSALELAHSHNVIHRDLKPENIFINKGAQGATAKLLDFGLCKQIDSEKKAVQTITETGFLVGTAHYMSPEQCMGSGVDLRSDVYSFGCVLYEMITGTPPFFADTPGGVFLMHMSKPMPRILDLSPGSGLPQELEDLLIRCCRKKKEDRYQSFVDIRKELAEISQLDCSAVFDGTQATKRRTRFRRVLNTLPKVPVRVRLGLAVVCLLLLCGATFFITCTDLGNVFLAVQIQSLMNPLQAIDKLALQLDSLLRSGRVKTGKDLVETTIKTRAFYSWAHEYREKLLLKYIAIFRNSRMDEEVFSLSLVLLQDLLESWLKSVELKTETPDITLLQNLSKELVKGNYSKKQWAQIHQIIEMKKNAFQGNPVPLVWTGYLRCVSGIKREARQTETEPGLQAKKYDSCLLMALSHGDPEFIKKVAGEYSAFNLAHRLPTYETLLHVDLGLYYAQNGRMDPAKQELAIAERFAGEGAFTAFQESFLQRLRQSCRKGKYVGNDFKKEHHETNVKWLLQYSGAHHHQDSSQPAP